MMMATVSEQQRNKIHPYKFTLWIAMGSMVMMFAGFTSAYVVKRNQSNWLEFTMPPVFWYSTFAILLSSLTLFLAMKAFKAREIMRYRALVATTACLGIAFIILQIMGFSYLEAHGVKLIGSGSNPAGSFLGVITGVHILHVLGGIVALLIILIRAYRSNIKSYNSTPIEVASIYWHFVDGLWIYLFIFYSYVSG